MLSTKEDVLKNDATNQLTAAIHLHSMRKNEKNTGRQWMSFVFNIREKRMQVRNNLDCIIIHLNWKINIYKNDFIKKKKKFFERDNK